MKGTVNKARRKQRTQAAGMPHATSMRGLTISETFSWTRAWLVMFALATVGILIVLSAFASNSVPAVNTPSGTMTNTR